LTFSINQHKTSFPRCNDPDRSWCSYAPEFETDLKPWSIPVGGVCSTCPVQNSDVRGRDTSRSVEEGCVTVSELCHIGNTRRHRHAIPPMMSQSSTAATTITTFRSILCAESWHWDSNNEHKIVFNEDGTGEVSVTRTTRPSSSSNSVD